MGWKFNKTVHAVPFDGIVKNTNESLRRVGWPELEERDGQFYFRDIRVNESDYIVGDISSLHPSFRTLVYTEEEFHERFIWCERAQPGEEISQFFLFWEHMEFSDKVEALIHFDVLHVNENLQVMFTSTNPYNLTPICIPVTREDTEDIFEWWRKDRLLGTVAWVTNKIGLLPEQYYQEMLTERGYDLFDGTLGPFNDWVFEERLDELQAAH